MPYFMVQAAYTAESWKAQIRDQGNIEDRLRPLAQALGGRLDSIYYAFGDYDVVPIGEFPDNETAAAVSLAAAAGGSAKAIKTTPLLTVSEGLEAMKKASRATGVYRPPVDQPAAV